MSSYRRRVKVAARRVCSVRNQRLPSHGALAECSHPTLWLSYSTCVKLLHASASETGLPEALAARYSISRCKESIIRSIKHVGLFLAVNWQCFDVDVGYENLLVDEFQFVLVHLPDETSENRSVDYELLRLMGSNLQIDKIFQTVEYRLRQIFNFIVE